MARRWQLVQGRWKIISAVVALTMVVIAPLVATAQETGSPNSVSAGPTLDRGTVTLRMNPIADAYGNAYFRWAAPDGTQKALQTFKQSGQCGYAPVSGNLVAVTALGGTPSFLAKDNGWGLGVKSSTVNEGASSCDQINNNETLVLTFNHGTGALGPNDFIDYAGLDMELKYTSMILSINLFKITGDGASTTTPVYSYTRTCTQTDCGPDSGGSDNRHVIVPIGAPNNTVLFDRVQISVSIASGGTQAAAALEGGSDAGTTASTFHVVTPAVPLACGSSTDATGGGTTTTVTLVPASNCTTKAVALSASSDQISVETGGSPSQQSFVVTSDWAPKAFSPGIYTTQVSPPTPSEAEVPCTGSFEPGTDPTGNAITAVQNGSITMPDGHSWCRIYQDGWPVIDNGSQLFQEFEVSLLIGDATRTKIA